MNSQTMNAASAPQSMPLETPVQSHGFELGDVLRILSEQRKIIFGAGVLGLILGIVAPVPHLLTWDDRRLRRAITGASAVLIPARPTGGFCSPRRSWSTSCSF